jgi:hypothetical protein
MQYKVFTHLMPWDIDYALLMLNQLKKSSYYLTGEDKIKLDIKLNLSSYIIDWENSQLPKEFFINKFSQLLKIIDGVYDCRFTVYQGDKIYGHLDSQKEVIDKETDFYIGLCPDMYFSEHLLALMIESSKQINNKYFILTPEISKLWDVTWDELTASEWSHVNHKDWNKVDVFDIRSKMKTKDQSITLDNTNKIKFAGWFDMWNKAFYEELVPLHSNWHGYGPWDWYSMMVAEFVKVRGVDIQQYVLRGQTIFEYSVGPLVTGGFSSYYKDFLKLKDIPNQRKTFESNMKEYVNIGLKRLQEKNII